DSQERQPLRTSTTAGRRAREAAAAPCVSMSRPCSACSRQPLASAFNQVGVASGAFQHALLLHPEWMAEGCFANGSSLLLRNVVLYNIARRGTVNFDKRYGAFGRMETQRLPSDLSATRVRKNEDRARTAARPAAASPTTSGRRFGRAAGGGRRPGRLRQRRQKCHRLDDQLRFPAGSGCGGPTGPSDADDRPSG